MEPALPDNAKSFLNVAIETALEAGKILREEFARPPEIKYKGDVDLVTQADKRSEQAIVDRLNTEIVASLKEPAFRERLASQGAVAFPLTPAQFGTYIHNQYEKWDKVIKNANIRLD